MDGVKLPLNFDDWKCYFNVSKPTTKQLNTLPKFTLTGELPYLPQKYIVARNLKVKNLEAISKWRA